MKRSGEAAAATDNYSAISLRNAVEPAEAFIGPNINATSCSTRSGKARKRYSWIERQLMHTKVYNIQSVYEDPETYRTRGTQVLNFRQAGTLGSATDPGGLFLNAISLPIYIFRLGVPNGAQQSFPTTNVSSVIRPLIGYRLHAGKLSGDTQYRYRWIRMANLIGNKTPNVDPLGLPVQQVVTEENQSVFAASSILHEASAFDLVYTAPTGRQSLLQTGVISFTREEYCPPDEFIGETGIVYNTIRANSGSFSITPAVVANEADQNDYSEYWTEYIAARQANPATLIKSFPKCSPIMKFHSKWSKVFGSQSTDNVNPVGIQHHHTHVFNRQAWLNTSQQSRASLTRASLFETTPLYGNSNTLGGVFPEPQAQRWFFVSAFSQAQVKASTAEFDVVTDPSFDFRLRQKFSATMIPNLSSAPV